jgi:hypothetical protein
MRRALAGLLIALAACGTGASQVEGIVTDVDGDLTTVSMFTVRRADGELFTFVPGEDGDFAFPLPHLSEHRQTASPVVVTYEQAPDGTLTAVAVDDAGESHR